MVAIAWHKSDTDGDVPASLCDKLVCTQLHVCACVSKFMSVFSLFKGCFYFLCSIQSKVFLCNTQFTVKVEATPPAGQRCCMNNLVNNWDWGTISSECRRTLNFQIISSHRIKSQFFLKSPQSPHPSSKRLILNPDSNIQNPQCKTAVVEVYTVNAIEQGSRKGWSQVEHIKQEAMTGKGEKANKGSHYSLLLIIIKNFCSIWTMLS